MKWGEKKWRVIRVYVGEGVEKMIDKMERWVRAKEEQVKRLIGRDFNARTAEEDGWIEEGEEEKRGRWSKDKKRNEEGKQLIEFLEEWGLGILNGRVRGDEEGEFTFTGGPTVIDYVIGNGEVEKRVERLRVGDKIDSDHPLEVWIRGERRYREGARGRGMI